MNSTAYPLTAQTTRKAGRAVAAACVFAAIAIAPSLASAKDASEDRAEARIKSMHAKLQITPAQEDQWGKITQEMRDNAKTMDALTDKRAANAKTMTAIDDLKSYAEITDAHARSIREFTPLFETLYASMSVTQKKEADEFFHNGEHGKGKVK